MNDTPEFSLVVPCYNEEDALPHFFAAAIPALEEMTGGSWRIVCVDPSIRVRYPLAPPPRRLARVLCACNPQSCDGLYSIPRT